MLNICKRKVVRVDLPGGDAGHVRVMSFRELAQFRAAIRAAEADPNRDVIAAETLVALTACDAEGNRLVPPGQEAAVADWPYAELVALFNAAAGLNGIVERPAEALPVPPAYDDDGNQFVVSHFNCGPRAEHRHRENS